ncbi:WW domain-binding protein 11-like [Triticum urartu]|uniref:WW domain-binding protein 11-like n=1 Tax=Triticum urartu TaxID=4572 RepID=UPI002043B885|nr:WW domain-binding protein 11-like [Triticum urartu]
MDEDAAAPTKKGRRRNRKRKGKTVLSVEGSSDPGAAKKARADDPGKEVTRWDKEKGQDGVEWSGKKRGGQGGRCGKDNQQERPAQGRDKKEEDDDHDEDDESGEHEFQKATEAISIRARSTISEDPTPNSTKTEQKVTGREPHSVTPHEPRRLRGSRQTLHGSLLPPLPSGQLPLRVTTSSQHRAPAAILPVLRPPSSPASGSLPPRAPAAFLAAPRPPPSPASGLLPPHAPAAFLPKIRPPSTPEIPAPVPNPFVRELGDWDALLAAASLLAVSGGSGVVAGTLSCSSPTTVKKHARRHTQRGFDEPRRYGAPPGWVTPEIAPRYLNNTRRFQATPESLEARTGSSQQTPISGNTSFATAGLQQGQQFPQQQMFSFPSACRKARTHMLPTSRSVNINHLCCKSGCDGKTRPKRQKFWPL